ncbi:MAG: C40 family peptidase [Candidatus Geothermincolia bacterium]
MVVKHKRVINCIVVLALVALACSFLAVMPAGLQAQTAGDIGSMSQQAAQIAAEIDALDKELAVASEAYNLVKVDLDAISERVDQTQKRLTEIKQSLKKRRDLLNARAASMYKDGKTTMLEVLLDTKDFGDFLERADYVSRVARSDADLIDRIKTTKDSVELLERQYSESKRQQEVLVQQAMLKKNDIEGKLGTRTVLLNSVNQDIQKLIAQQVTEQRASDQTINQQAQQTLVTAPDGGLAKTCMRYLGVVYHWAGAGPGQCPSGQHRICFDCSGLTMYVYKLFGIDLPHNAAMQFNKGVKITLQQARPGDLVYFGMPPHHVGMYLGNDMFIHAPQTGDVVKVSKLSSRKDLSGITRFTK